MTANIAQQMLSQTKFKNDLKLKNAIPLTDIQQ